MFAILRSATAKLASLVIVQAALAQMRNQDILQQSASCTIIFAISVFSYSRLWAFCEQNYEEILEVTRL